MRPASAFSARARRQRGFTLAELMAAVAITGILAAIAVATFHRRALESNVANAKVVIKSIAVAQEHYRAENQVYFDVSTEWYPSTSIAINTRQSFWRSTDDAETKRWRTLAPDIRQPVEFVFKTNAGLPDTAPALDTTDIKLGANAAVEPWYVVQARADADGDGTYCWVAAASWTPDVVSANDGE